MTLLESLCRFAWKRCDKSVIRVRAVHRQEMRLLLHSSDHNQRFAEVGLCLTRRMHQRHEHLPTAQFLRPRIVLDDGVAAGEPMFFL